MNEIAGYKYLKEGGKNANRMFFFCPQKTSSPVSKSKLLQLTIKTKNGVCQRVKIGISGKDINRQFVGQEVLMKTTFQKALN